MLVYGPGIVLEGKLMKGQYRVNGWETEMKTYRALLLDAGLNYDQDVNTTQNLRVNSSTPVLVPRYIALNL